MKVQRRVKEDKKFMFINFGGIFMKASCVRYHKYTAVVTVEPWVGVEAAAAVAVNDIHVSHILRFK